LQISNKPSQSADHTWLKRFATGLDKNIVRRANQPHIASLIAIRQ